MAPCIWSILRSLADKQEWDTFSVMVKEAKDWLGDKEKLFPTWKQVSEKFIPP